MLSEKELQDNLNEMLCIMGAIGGDRFCEITTHAINAKDASEKYFINNSFNNKLEMLICITYLVHCIFDTIESLKKEYGEVRVEVLKNKCELSVERLKLIK